MNTKLFISSIFLSTSLSLFAQKSATITLHTDRAGKSFPKKSTANLQSIWELVSMADFG